PAEPPGSAGLFCLPPGPGTCPTLPVSFRKRTFRLVGASPILNWCFWSAAFQRRFLWGFRHRKNRKRRFNAALQNGGRDGEMRAVWVWARRGGGDGSVAAYLLRRQGYDVIGLFMRTGAHGGDEGPARKKGCCSALDAGDARRVADRLDIPFYALDFERD